jgi:hypothetical protein
LHPLDWLCAALSATQKRGTVKTALKHTGQAVAGVLPAALLVRLGTHGVAAMIVFAVLVIVLGGVVVVLAFLGRGMLRWIIDSGERSDRVSRMLLARRGDARCLKPGTSASSSSGSR